MDEEAGEIQIAAAGHEGYRLESIRLDGLTRVAMNFCNGERSRVLLIDLEEKVIIKSSEIPLLSKHVYVKFTNEHVAISTYGGLRLFEKVNSLDSQD